MPRFVGIENPAAAGGGSVTSVDARTGVVTLDDLYQPKDADLTAIAGLNSATAGVSASDGAGWIHKTYAALKTALGLVKADVGLSNVDNTSNATERAATATLTNKTLTSPVVNTPTGIVKGDVGLGNVDNTSNATERAATATLTNKSMSGTANTFTNLPQSAVTKLPGDLTTLRYGNLTILGHSYVAGATQNDTGVANVYQESVVSKLQAMLGIQENNVRHFGQAASRLTSGSNANSGSTFTGWVSALQFFMPNSSINVNAAADAVILDQNVASGGPLLLVHGLNDMTANAIALSAETFAQCVVAWKHALRTCVSRYRAGQLFCSTRPAGTITWDSTLAFSGTWTDIASGLVNTGPAYKRSNTNADYVEITLPTNFKGGTVAVCFSGTQNGFTRLNGAITVGATSMVVDSAEEFPPSAAYVARIAAEGANTAEDVLVTAGQGTTTWTITRGVNGTTASAHGDNAGVTIQPTTLVTWSTNGANANITGTTTPTAAGHAGAPVSVIKRFACTGADAGKTIRATLSGHVVGAGDYINFDSWWLESDEPPPVVVTNVQYWQYGTWFKTWANWQADLITFNAATDTVVAEFDSWVKVADAYTPFKNRAGLITAAMNNTDVTTVIGWTCNSTTYTPTVGTRVTFGNTNFGGVEELCDVTAVTGTTPNWTLTLTRGAGGTPKLAHANGDFLSPNEWMHKDEIHLSIKGHSVFAELCYQALVSMPTPSTYQLAAIQGNWSQDSRASTMGLVDGNWLTPPVGSWSTRAVPQNTEGAMPIYIPRDCVVTGIASVVSVGTAATIRYGLYMPDRTHSRPGRLLVDFGTQVDSAQTAPWISDKLTVYQVLRPGWYWLSAVQQATAVTLRTCNALGLTYPQLSISAVPTGASVAVNGYTRTGITGALTDWATWTEATNSPDLPIVWLRLRSVDFA